MAGVVRIVQVGLGRWGLDWASKVVREVGTVELVGCVDKDPGGLSKACSHGFVQPEGCFESLEAALAELDFEAVLVTTELNGHAQVVHAALEAGKHVLVEKPFALSVVEGEALVALAAKTDRTLMVSQNYRFFPAVRAVQRLVREEELGQLVHVAIDFRRFSPPQPGRVSAARAWAQPLLLDMAIHHFDLLRAVVPGQARSIYCRSWNPEWSGYVEPPEATAMISFDDVAVSYRGSWLYPERTTPWAGEWRMEFEEGELWWSSRSDRHDQRQAAEDQVWHYTHDGKRTGVELPRLEFVDRAGVLAAFAESVMTGTEPESSGGDNLGSLSLAYAAVASAANGELVELD